MKTSVLFGTVMLFFQTVYCQKHDFIWVTGDSNDSSTTFHGGALIDFNATDTVLPYYNYRKLNMFLCNASICDSTGKLLMYTNGCDIAGADDEIIENGAMINPGLARQVSCVENNDGYASGIQSALFLQLPDIDSIYFLFHKQIKLTTVPVDAFTEKLLYSTVDMRKNGGLGNVTEKNIDILKDTLSYGELIAIKHANGKDWWIITPRRNSNTFYILRFTAQGIIDTLQQTIGIQTLPQGEGYGQMVSSPEGSMIYRTNPYNPVMMYSFDRENSVLSGFDTISYTYGSIPRGEIGCAVSPNGRYLYLGARRKLFQFDLLAPDISASQTLVAEWDGYANPIATLFWQLQLGPDCKIYGLAGGDTRFYHVIHNPDEPGLACNVEQRGLPLPTPSGSSIPSFPNYRLGPLDNPGLPCTATVGSQQVAAAPEGFLRVYPNPASDHLNIIANHPLPSGACWLLSNAQGRVLHTEMLSEHSTCMEIPLPSLPSGVYFWHLQTKEGAVVSAGKVVVNE